jgi:penicillin amidase
METVLGRIGPGIGSNSWAVSGERTDDGQTPARQRYAPRHPNAVHLVSERTALRALSAKPAHVRSHGLLVRGVPGVVAGHNAHIAWAFTNLGPDVQDLFIEKVNPENPNQYEVDGKWVDFEIRKETIPRR